MDFRRLVNRGLWHHRRMHLAAVAGVAAATAVLTGALLVGDSMRGSLRRLAVDSLGQFDHVLLAGRFFREPLADELAAAPGFDGRFRAAVPAVILPRATARRPDVAGGGRASAVNVIASGPDFWSQDTLGAAPRVSPGPGEVVLNGPLADELGAKPGDSITLQLPSTGGVPADSVMGRKDQRVRSLGPLKVVDVVPARGLGRFGLHTSQHLPKNAYLGLETLQNALGEPGKINAILVAGNGPIAARTPDVLDASADALAAMLRPTLEDFGIEVHRVRRTFRPPGSDVEETIFDYANVTTDRLMFEPALDARIDRAFSDHSSRPVLTYLANTIEKTPAEKTPGEKTPAEDMPAEDMPAEDMPGEGAAGKSNAGIPYSMVAALDVPSVLGPLADADGRPIDRLADDEIVLNRWAAEDLDAKVGDRIEIAYFAPETTHTDVEERRETFRLAAVVPLAEPAQPYSRRAPAVFETRPARANDPHLTPSVEGVTDQEAIDDWDPPFPFAYARIRGVDEVYWDNHRTTPKAFVSLAAGRRLWQSRFGRTTSMRVEIDGEPRVEWVRSHLETQLADHAGELGFAFRGIRRGAIRAAAGTTPFNVLFLGFSFFIIAAAVMLVALLFRLGLEQRAGQLGLLLAVGIDRRRAARVFLAEATAVSLIGGLAGVPLGVGYAQLMIVGLHTRWLAAVVTPFLQLHVTPLSLAVGLLASVAVCRLTVGFSVRQMGRVSVPLLLAGRSDQDVAPVGTDTRRWNVAAASALVTAIGLGLLAVRLAGEAQAGAFFGSGAMTLAAAMIFLYARLRRAGARPTGRFTLGRLAARNAARNPRRSILAAGLIASAAFLIVAIGAFRLDPSERGAGGFAIVGQSDRPVFVDLNVPRDRRERLGDRAGSLDGATVLSMRVRPGDDASCRNLYRSRRPRVLGVGTEMVRHFDDPDTTSFAWAASAARDGADRANPWRLLSRPLDDAEAVPVVLDKNTAMYALHLYRGIGEQFTYEYDGRPTRFRVVGLLANSIFQGSLLVDESRFRDRFPEVNGYRYFLADVPADARAEATAVLEDKFAAEGLDLSDAESVLADLLAVQNTYLDTFQSLGAIGLLLGTFGLATVQTRNVLQRRGELALLRAAGFGTRRLASLVMLENVALLLAGLGIGIAAAAVAVVPHAVFAQATVPIASLAVLLTVVLTVGTAAGLIAVRVTQNAPIVKALRGD